MDHQNRLAFLEIIKDRHGKSSVGITSQLPVSRWYDSIAEKAITDAAMDRLVYPAHRYELQGVSMRKKKAGANREGVAEITQEICANKLSW